MTTSEHTLSATLRDQSIKSSSIRAAGQTPAVLYGKQVEPKAVSFNATELARVFHKAGFSSLVEINLSDGSQQVVLFKDAQHDPVTGAITHVDLYAVNMTEKIKADIPLAFINEAPALTTFEAVLVTNKDSVEVECLPRDLPHSIEIDLSVLTELDSNIKVADIKAPAGVEILDDAEEIVVLVSEQREEEEAPVVSEAEAIAAVEATAEKPADEAQA